MLVYSSLQGGHWPCRLSFVSRHTRTGQNCIILGILLWITLLYRWHQAIDLAVNSSSASANSFYLRPKVASWASCSNWATWCFACLHQLVGFLSYQASIESGPGVKPSMRTGVGEGWSVDESTVNWLVDFIVRWLCFWFSRVWPHFVQKKLYEFLRYNFEWWPLDAMFRLVCCRSANTHTHHFLLLLNFSY